MSEPIPTDPSCIFCRIISREAPATIRYESESVIAFDDHHPHVATHVLICPKGHYPTFLETPPEILADLNAQIKQVARHLGFSERGFRLQINNGAEAGQIVFHLHYHFMSKTSRPKE